MVLHERRGDTGVLGPSADGDRLDGWPDGERSQRAGLVSVRRRLVQDLDGRVAGLGEEREPPSADERRRRGTRAAVRRRDRARDVGGAGRPAGDGRRGARDRRPLYPGGRGRRLHRAVDFAADDREDRGEQHSRLGQGILAG